VRLAIDAVGAKHSGAATILVAVVEAALRCVEAERIVVYASVRPTRKFELPVSPNLRVVDVPEAESGLGRVLWHERGLAQRIGRSRVDALLCLSGGGSGGPEVPSTLFVQQSLPFSPEALARMGVRDRVRMAAIRQVMRRSALRSARVLVQTRTMKEWVAGGLGVQAARISVIEPDVPVFPRVAPVPELAEMRGAAQAGPVLLYVGNASAYKNLEVLMPAMAEIERLAPSATLFGTFP
jgi:hypothetical protein